MVVYDVHYPFYHKPTWNAILDFVKNNQPHIAGFLFGGDCFDNQEIAHHTSSKPLFRPTGSYKRNSDNFDKLILSPLEAALPRQASRAWITGNHERFESDLVERQPELKGMVEHDILLNLRERQWEVLALGEAKALGKLNAIHGEGLTGIGNQASLYHAKRAVETYCSSVLYGHVHTTQSYTKVLPHNTKNKWVAYASPCCCNLNPGYLQNRPTAWVNGFSIVELHDPEKANSNFNVYPIIVSDGKFSFGGNVYGT